LVVVVETTGAKALHVEANPRAEPFYLACACEITGQVQTRCGTASSKRRSVPGEERSLCNPPERLIRTKY
jgi:hypothetical protein